jgi:FkbM family methyltransferase
MSLKDTLQFILYHPLNNNQKLSAIWRFFYWQIRNLFVKIEIQFNFGESSQLYLKRGMTGASGNYYCGLHDFKDMAFIMHFLRSHDQFIDIGANIGSYTILAASEVGAKTISFEPIPSTFKVLIKNVELNSVQNHVQALNIGLGSQPGILKFTNNLDTVNHVAFGEEENIIDIQVKTLDQIEFDDRTTFIKIDVEGFESDVISGAKNILSNNNTAGLIIELNGSGKRYGHVDFEIHKILLGYGYKPFDYLPFSRKLVPLQVPGNINTIYIRNEEFTKERVKNSRKYRINGVEF